MSALNKSQIKYRIDKLNIVIRNLRQRLYRRQEAGKAAILRNELNVALEQKKQFQSQLRRMVRRTVRK
jgi:hypothetical protein